MKKKILKSISIIGLFFVFTLSNCNQEEVQPREFPRVETLEVTEIDSDGATLNARIISQGNQEISEYGFVWGQSTQIDIDRGEWKTIKGSPTSDVFSIRVSATLEKNKRYYVKAYTKTKDFKTYGSTPSFISLGSEAPTIETFSPSHANIGDTIYVLGKNFSTLEYTTSAFIGGIKSRVISTNYDTIQIIVPDTINAKESVLSISVAGNISKANSLFTINPPEIESFSPAEAFRNSIVTIDGANFGYGEAKVFFGENEAVIKSVSSNQIKVFFPQNLDPIGYTIQVLLFGQIGFSTNKIISNDLYIKNFYPKNGTWDTEVSIDVLNFDSSITPRVEFNGDFAPIISKTDSLIIVTFPKSQLDSSTTIKIITDEKSAETLETFTLDPVEIYDFEPKRGTVGNNITISGKNFHPYLSRNRVSFLNNGRSLSIISSNTNTITAKILNDTFKESDFVNVSNGSSEKTSDEIFELITPQVFDFFPKTASVNETITVIGKGFSLSPNFNTIETNDNSYSANSSSDTLLTFILSADGPSNQSKIRVQVGDHSSESDDIITFPWRKGILLPDDDRNRISGFLIEDAYYYGLGFSNQDYTYSNITDQRFYKYNLTNNNITQLSDFPFNSFWEGISFTYNGKGYLGLGNYEIGNSPNNNIWEYNKDSDLWSLKTVFPGENLSRTACFVIGDYLYVGTGTNGYYLTNEFWSYDLINDLWETVESFPGSFRYASNGFSIGEYGYIGYGQGNDDGSYFNYRATTYSDFWKYDPSTNQWTEIASPNEIGNFYATSFTINDMVYIMGGFRRGAVWRYDVSQNSWDQVSTYDMGRNSDSYITGFGYKNKGYLTLGRHYDEFVIYSPELDNKPVN